MVVSAHREASAVGQRILEAGGHAVDAAVAVGYALAVVDPCCGNLGGGGFMLIRLAEGRTIFVDFRETAPRAATRDMFLDASGNVPRDQSLYGYRAAGVPGTVNGARSRPDAIRPLGSRAGHGAGDRLGARWVCSRRSPISQSSTARPRNCRRGSGSRQDFSAPGRQPFSARRPAHPKRFGGDARGHRRTRPGRLLPRSDSHFGRGASGGKVDLLAAAISRTTRCASAPRSPAPIAAI